MGWLDHARLGFNYRLSDVAAALGVAQLEKLDAMLADRARVASLYAEGLAGVEGVRAPIAGRGAGAAQLVRLRGPAARRGRPRRDRSPGSPSAASPARPTCPASTSSRTCASSATARGSSRLPKQHRRARWRCPSSRPWRRPRSGACARLSPNRSLMSRFRKDPDPRFWRINRSIEFDWRLAPYDIDQSQAHARGLHQIGVLDAAELQRIDAGLERVRAAHGRARLRVRGGRRGHPHGDRAPARRGDRPAGRQAPHRAARATTRSPPTWRWSSRRTRCGRSSWPGRRWSGCSSSPSATATGRCPATPTCSAPSRSTSATTCSPTSGCSAATCCASSSPSTAPR